MNLPPGTRTAQLDVITSLGEKPYITAHHDFENGRHSLRFSNQGSCMIIENPTFALSAERLNAIADQIHETRKALAAIEIMEKHIDHLGLIVREFSKRVEIIYGAPLPEVSHKEEILSAENINMIVDGVLAQIEGQGVAIAQQAAHDWNFLRNDEQGEDRDSSTKAEIVKGRIIQVVQRIKDGVRAKLRLALKTLLEAALKEKPSIIAVKYQKLLDQVSECNQKLNQLGVLNVYITDHEFEPQVFTAEHLKKVVNFDQKIHKARNIGRLLGGI